LSSMAKRNRINCLNKKWEKSYKKSEKAKDRRKGKKESRGD